METEIGFPAVGQKVTIVGAVVAAVSTLLPWFGAETPVDISPTTLGVDTTLGVVTLLVSLLVGLLVAFLEWDVETIAVSVLGGVIVGLLALLKFADFGGVAGAKAGLYLALIGGVVMLVGGVMGYSGSDGSTGDPLGG